MHAHLGPAQTALQHEPFLPENPPSKPHLAKNGHVSIQPIAFCNSEDQQDPSKEGSSRLSHIRDGHANQEPHWRPFYLRRRIVAVFLVIFALILVAIEILIVVSDRNDGISTATPGEHYLWTYGPVAFLTLVAAAFGRLEFQSKISAPWEHMARRSSKAADSLLLDYLLQFQPVTVYKALRNKDYTVAASTVISLLVKVMIVFSTGLITLSLTQVHLGSVPMTLQDRFANNDAALAATDTLPYYIMQGLIGTNLTYPAGISSEFAYQYVKTNLSSTAQSQARVDGLTNSLVCEPVELNMTGAEPPDPHYSYTTMNLTITAPDCDMKLRLLAPEVTYENENATSLLFARFAQAECDGTSDDTGRRVFVMFGDLAYAIDTSVNLTDYTGQTTFHPRKGRLLQSAQLLCSPDYTITTVEVVQNGTSVENVTLAEGASNRTLDMVTGWDIMDAHFASYQNSIDNIGNYYSSSIIYLDEEAQTAIDVDPYASFMIQAGFPSSMNSSALFDQETLQQVATSYYQQYGAIVAKQFLMESASTSTTGTAILTRNRLVVRLWAGQTMAGLAAACCLLTLICLFTVLSHGVVPRDPNTLHGMAAILSQSSAVMRKLRDLGDADDKILNKSLRTSTFRSEVDYVPSAGRYQYFILPDANMDRLATDSQCKTTHAHPMVLNPVIRACLGVILLGLILALELTLRKSNREDGLGDVGNDTYLHYLWTALPSVILGSLAMAFSAIDLKTRSLLPYLLLQKGVNTSTFTSFHLLDSSVPHALWKEIRLKNVGAVATTATLLVAAFFTVFSGSLFQELTFPVTQTIALRANTSFPMDAAEAMLEANLLDGTSLGDIAASLILDSNLTYPSFTYENLVFPQYLPNSTLDLSGQSILATIPAVRGGLDCRMYDSSVIHTNLTLNYTSEDYTINPLWIDIDGEMCRSRSVLADPDEFEDTSAWYTFGFGVETNVSYFGQGGMYGDGSNGCSEMAFTWGLLDFTNIDDPVSYIAAVGCNTSYETLQVETNFISDGSNSDLRIDATNPPRPLESTAHNSTAWIDLELMYTSLADVHTSELLNSFFSLLTTSRWAIPISMLGGTSNSTSDDDTAQTVADAIQFQHFIILAQVLSNSRILANETNATLAYPPPASLADGSDADPLYIATATDVTGRRRVVQDAVSTRTLEGLLAAALLLLLVGSICVRNTDVLATSPTSIASVVALLAGGNLVQEMSATAAVEGDALPQGPHDETVKNAFGSDTKFWLGWGNMPDEEGIEAGNENQSGVSRFGIFAVRNGAVEQPGKAGVDSDASSVLLGAE
ncbi:hypothetical protein BD289DRAFT_437208 [Coniella lustricola]|uniref:Uncharacterized protein n=1 Tax=Coniella lustricola TaxID=2025994 RepID=A0A2T3A4C4_9PEZI|nr:hypothetical protein BD289DRAFT_437208 [Coniella lustricola]